MSWIGDRSSWEQLTRVISFASFLYFALRLTSPLINKIMLGKIKTKQEKSGGKWENCLRTKFNRGETRESRNTVENPLLEVMFVIYQRVKLMKSVAVYPIGPRNNVN